MDCRCWCSVAAGIHSFLRNIMSFFFSATIVFGERPLINQPENRVVVSIYSFNSFFSPVSSIWCQKCIVWNEISNVSSSNLPQLVLPVCTSRYWGDVRWNRHPDTRSWLESDHECFLHNLGRALRISDSATVRWKVARRWCMLPLHICHLVTVNASFTQLTPPTQQKCDRM